MLNYNKIDHDLMEKNKMIFNLLKSLWRIQVWDINDWVYSL